MSRRIVFAGGVQTRALARIYRSEVAAQAGDDVIFIGTGAVGTDAARSTLLMADILAMEIDEDGDAIPADALPGQASVVRIPNLYCDFLWPFAGRAHPRNRGAFALPGGPYPSEHGDRFLDQMVADGVYETTAITRYKAMDIAVEGELDSRLADRSAILARLDESAGYDLAPFIIDRFRVEPLFRTRQRLTMPLLARLVDQSFAKLGVQGWRAESLKRVPFPAGAQPLHPGVIAHFGLGWATAQDSYPLNEEGTFTFEEFCRRYMGFVWNETLHRGIQAAKTNPAGAIADLEQGLADSPDSRLGTVALIVARHAADPALGAADPALVIDEESYDPAAEASPVIEAPPAETQVAETAAAEASVAETHTEEAHEAVATEADATEADAPEAAPELVEAKPEHVEPDEPEAALVASAAPESEADLPAGEATLDEPAAPIDAPAALEPVIPDAKPDAAEDDLIAEVAPTPPAARSRAKAEPAERSMLRAQKEEPRQGSVADGFTDFRPIQAPQPSMAVASDDLIEALPSLLPVFADLANTVDRPFGAMPEVMPPPPLRPILPPELQDEEPRPGLLARMLGRK